MDETIKNYLSKIGRAGGRKSRRQLTPSQALDMVHVREARRAFKKYHTECFWSYDPEYVITKDDLQWVGEKLMQNGDLKLWQLGAKLCR